MQLILCTKQKGLHLLSLPARILAAYIKRSECGSVSVSKKRLATNLGLSKDELNIAIGELMLQGLLRRWQDPATRKHSFVIHQTVRDSKNEFVGKSKLRWPSFSGVYAEKDYAAYCDSVRKLNKE